MKHPLFSVGEKVLLQSKSRPDCNGEYIVEAIVGPGTQYFDRRVNHTVLLEYENDKIGYLLNKSFDSWIDKFEIKWSESALRKKHKPSQFTFDQLISEIKCPRSIMQ